MKLSFWRKTAAVLMAALLALSTPVLAISETVEAAATAETTAAPVATEAPVVTEAPVETEATTAPAATKAAETTVPETTDASQEAPAKAAPIELLPIDGDVSMPVAAEYTVTYTDGANGAVFADQSYTVKKGDATPAFVGKPAREGYAFTGWQPEVAATVTDNATYTAQWIAEPDVPSGSNSIKELFKFHCVTTPDEHADQTYNWFGSYVKYNGDMKWDNTRGVFTATANITNVQTMLSSGVNSPEKVWKHKHYHTDANGKDVRETLIK